MKVKLNRSTGKVNAFVFALCGLSVRNLTFLFVGIALGEQMISVAVEYLIFGERFQHWFDSVFLFCLTSAYFHFSCELGDFLLDLHLNGEIKD